MAESDPTAPIGLQLGKPPTGSFFQLRSDEPVPFTSSVQTSAGHLLVRDPVGFPHHVILQCPQGLLPEAGKLRLMKAFSRAALKVQQALGDVGPLQMRILVDPAASATPEATAGPCYTVAPAWLDQVNGSLVSLRSAVLALVEAHGALLVQTPPPALPSPGPTPAQVLLFKNIFTLDVESNVARQINPGVHYLISPLLADGAELVLLDGKLPLHDVCERPPALDEELAPSAFLTDPDELAEALAANPGLNLVCLTVLERSYAQIRDLCTFIRARSQAFIAVGGVFATVTPEHCFAHLPQVDFVVRGDGEDVLPALARVVAGRTRERGLDDDRLAQLGGLEGVIARTTERTVAVQLDRVNRVANLDDVRLDFSFFERENVESGLSVSTSRGCLYACRFCSVMDKTCWRGKSVPAVMRDLAAYEVRLVELYGSAGQVPETARRLQIWDDDLFIEPERAAALLPQLVEAGFTATFLQGTVASFYRRQGRKITRELNEELLDAIPPTLFTAFGGLKIGTESFNDAELSRLGKPYDFDQVNRLVQGLSRRGIKQEHFRILCSRVTSLDELLDNVEKIAELRWAVGPLFSVLEPSWLMNLFPTALYRACQVQSTDLEQPRLGVLATPDYAELDYPFILPERPERSEVFEVVRRFPSGMHYGMAGQPDWMFDGVYSPDDRYYLRVFEYVSRALRERHEALSEAHGAEARGERFRIEKALGSRLGGQLRIPLGLAARLAPELHVAPAQSPLATQLADYLAALLDDARERGALQTAPVVQAEPGGVGLEVEHHGVQCRFLVQRFVEGVDCAFHTRNLAVIVQSSVATESERQRLRGVIEHLRQLLQKSDTATLD